MDRARSDPGFEIAFCIGNCCDEMISGLLLTTLIGGTHLPCSDAPALVYFHKAGENDRVRDAVLGVIHSTWSSERDELRAYFTAIERVSRIVEGNPRYEEREVSPVFSCFMSGGRVELIPYLVGLGFSPLGIGSKRNCVIPFFSRGATYLDFVTPRSDWGIALQSIEIAMDIRANRYDLGLFTTSHHKLDPTCFGYLRAWDLIAETELRGLCRKHRIPLAVIGHLKNGFDSGPKWVCIPTPCRSILSNLLARKPGLRQWIHMSQGSASEVGNGFHSVDRSNTRLYDAARGSLSNNRILGTDKFGLKLLQRKRTVGEATSLHQVGLELMAVVTIPSLKASTMYCTVRTSEGKIEPWHYVSGPTL